MAKEPWEEELYEEVEETDEEVAPKRQFRAANVISTPVLTVLLGVFFLIVLVIFGVVLYTSNGGGSKNATDGFYGASTSSSSVKASASKKASSTTKESSKASDEEVEEATDLEESTTEASSSAKKTAKSSSTKKKTTRSSSTTELEEEIDEDPYALQAETTPSSNGGTIAVNAGEGAGQIAARAGISIERLQELNPSHMTNGYWYANPGDVVYVN